MPVSMTDFAQTARNATAKMRNLFAATPLQRNDFLSARFDADIWLKREDLSPVRSYKIRGAFNAMTKALATQPNQSTFVCASAGNHAQGVAFNCRHFGVKGVIFMPVWCKAVEFHLRLDLLAPLLALLWVQYMARFRVILGAGLMA